MLRLRGPEICLYLLFCVNIVLGSRNCDVSDISEDQCSANEYCSERNRCECLSGFQRLNDTFCASTKNTTTPNYSSLVDDSGSSSLVAGILVPLCLVVLVIGGAYAAKRYNLVGWLRHKIHQRNSSYDEFMIGHDIDDDDDPPIR